jgi:hypothetical protein
MLASMVYFSLFIAMKWNTVFLVEETYLAKRLAGECLELDGISSSAVNQMIARHAHACLQKDTDISFATPTPPHLYSPSSTSLVSSMYHL